MPLNFLNNGYFAGTVGIGTDDPSRGVLQVNGDFETTASGNGQLAIISGVSGSDPTASDVGGQMVFGGPISATDSNRTFALVGGYKENGTSGNRAGYLSFGTRENTGARDIVERMRIDSTGNVGIGTDSPGAKLEVVDGNNYAKIGDLQGNSTMLLRMADNSGFPVEVQAYGTELRFNTATTSGATPSVKMTILPSGNVGIGTTSPAQDFVVADATNGNGIELVPGATATIQTYNRGTSSYNNINIDTNSARIRSLDYTAFYNGTFTTERMRITSGGNVGIGTTLPTTALTIRKAISPPTTYGAQASMIEFKSYYTGYDTETVKSAIYSGVSDVTGLQTTRGFMSFWTADFVTGGGESLTEKMRIESNGNVGIGTDSPVSELHISKSKTGNVAISVQNTNASYSSQIRFLNSVGTERSAITFVPSDTSLRFFHNGGDRMFINSSGNVGIGTDSPGSRRLSVVKDTGITTGFNDIAEFLDTTLGSGGSVSVNFGRENSNKNIGKITFKYSSDGSSDNSLNLGFYGADDLVTLLADGNLGIGNNNPGAKLTVSENAAGLVSAITNSNGGGSGVQITAANGTNNSLQVRNYAGGELMRVQGDGDVGIGATVPGARLHVENEGGSTTTPNVVLIVQANTASTISTGGGTSIEFKGVSSGGNIQNYQQARIRSVGQAGNNAHGFAIDVKPNAATALTERLFLSSGGALRLSSYGAGTLVTDASGNITVSSGGGAGGPYLPLAGGTMTGTIAQNGGNIDFSDGRSANFGDGDDLQIYHDGNNSYINETGTGSLVLKTGALLVRNPSDASMLDAQSGGAINLYYNGSKKFETTSTGVAATGDIKIDSALLSNQENTDVDTGTETVASVAVATYTAAFFDFVVKKGTNVRSGTVYACHNGDTTPLVEFTETSTQDLGDTSDVTLSVDISGGNMRLQATTTSDDWSIKSLIRAI